MNVELMCHISRIRQSNRLHSKIVLIHKYLYTLNMHNIISDEKDFNVSQFPKNYFLKIQRECSLVWLRR